MSLLTRYFHIFIIFCHLNLVMTSCWSGHHPLYDADFIIKVKPLAITAERPQESLRVTLMHKNNDGMGQTPTYTKTKTVIPFYGNFTTPDAYNLARITNNKQFMGVYWRVAALPGLELMALRDGSVLISGLNDLSRSFAFITPGAVFMQQSQAQSVAFKAQQVTICEDTQVGCLQAELTTPQSTLKITDTGHLQTNRLTMIKGTVVNHGRLSSSADQQLNLQGNAFINHGTWQSLYATTLLNGGTITNHRTMQCPAFTMTSKAFANHGTLESSLLSILTTDRCHNKGTIHKQQQTTIQCLGTFINDGTFQSQVQTITAKTAQWLPASTLEGTIINLNSYEATVQGQVKATQAFILQTSGHSTLEASTTITTPHFTLSGAGTVTNHMTTERLQVAKHIDFKNFTGTFVNKAAYSTSARISGQCQQWTNEALFKTTNRYDLVLKRLVNTSSGQLLGQGQLTIDDGLNYGELGQQHERLALTINDTFTNYGLLKTSHIKGKGAFYNHNILEMWGTATQPAQIAVHTFTNTEQAGIPDGAKISGDHLHVTDAVKNWQHNSGLIHVNTITLDKSANNAAFDSTGNIIAHALHILRPFKIVNGKVTVNDLYATASTLTTAAGTVLHVHNTMDVTLDSLDNHGKIIVGQALTGKIRAFNNPGELLVVGTTALNESALTNIGKMILQGDITGYANTITNEGNLQFEGDRVHWQGFINRQQCRISPKIDSKIKSHYSFGQFDNYSVLELLNRNWVITETTSKEQTPAAAAQPSTLTTTHFNNQGEITSAQGLDFRLKTAPGKLTAGTALTVNRPEDTLQPIDLQGLRVGKDGKLVVTAKNFEIHDNIHLEVPFLVLRLSGRLLANAHFKTGNLEVDAQGPFIAGTSNDKMGGIETTGAMTMAAHSIDARYGQIFSHGPAVLTATHGDITVGATHVEKQGWDLWQEILLDINVNSGKARETRAFMADYTRLKRYANNKAYISGNNTLTLVTQRKSIIADGGEIYAGVLLNLLTHPTFGQIKNTSGSIRSLGDIRIIGLEYLGNRSTVDKIWLNKIGYMNESGCWGQFKTNTQVEANQPSTLQAQQNIHFDTTKVTIESSNVLAGQSILIHGKSVLSGNQPYTNSFNLISADRYEWIYGSCIDATNRDGFLMHTVKPSPCRLMAGEMVHIVSGSTVISGNIHAPQVKMNIGSLLAECGLLSRPEQPQLKSNIIIDLGALGQEAFKHGGFMKALPDGRVVTDRPVDGGIIPDRDQIVLYQPDGAALIPVLPAQYTFAIDKVILPFLIQQGLAQHLGKLNIDDKVGLQAVEQLYKNAGEIKGNNNSAIVSLKDMKKAQKSFIAYVVKTIENKINLAATLVLNKDEISPYQQPGDIAGDYLKIDGTKDFNFRNNRMVGDYGVDIHTQGAFDAQTEKFSITYSDGENSTRVEYARPTMSFLSPYGDVNVAGDKRYRQKAVAIDAGGSVHRKSAQGSATVEDLTLTTTSTSKSTKSGWFSNSTTITTNTSHSFKPSVTTARGGEATLTSHAEAKVVVKGSIEQARDKLNYKGGAAELSSSVAHNTSNSTTFSSNGLCGRSSVSSSSQTPVFNKTILQAPEIVFENSEVTAAGVHLLARALHNRTKNGMNLSPAIGVASQETTTTQSSAFGTMKAGTSSGREIGLNTRLDVDEVLTQNSPLHMTSVEWDQKKTKIQGAYTECIRHLNSWSHTYQHGSTLDPSTAALISLAVGIATVHMGGPAIIAQLKLAEAGLAATCVSAGFGALCSHAATSLAANGFDPVKTVHSMASQEFVVAMASAVASAGLIHEIGVLMKLPTGIGPKTVLQHAQQQGVKSGVNLAFDMAVHRQSPDAAIQKALKGFVANTLGGVVANQIGANAATLSYIEHKAAHAALGAMMGGIMNIGDNVGKGALSGAVGGVTAEIVMEAISQDAQERIRGHQQRAARAGIHLTKDQIGNILNQELRVKADIAKLAAGAVALGAGLDVNVAASVAENAVQNNFMVFLYYGAIAAGIAYAGYQAIDIYECEGFVPMLKHLGIELVLVAVPAGAAKLGLKGATIAAPHLAKAGQKFMYKMGGQELEFTTAREALLFVLDKNPHLKLAMGKFADTLILAAEKFEASLLGQGIAKVEGQLIHMEQQVVQKVADSGVGKAVSTGIKNVQEKFGISATKTIDANILWGKGIQQQGMPWEDYLEKTLPAGSRLPKNFKTFDFYDEATRTAISAKTLNTQTAAKLANPEKIYTSLKKNIDATSSFTRHKLLKFELKAEDIATRQLEVAIPQGTNDLQWQQINRAIKYANSKNVNLNTTIAK